MNKILAYFSLGIPVVLFLACSQMNPKLDTQKPSNPQKVHDLSSDIIGSWLNLSMTVTYLDTDSIFKVPEGEWENILKIKPILTEYKVDSTFESKYFDLNDSLLFTSSGHWHFTNDSLYLTNNGNTTAYKFSMDGDVGHFMGILDWNEDGLKRELYAGKQKKILRN